MIISTIPGRAIAPHGGTSLLVRISDYMYDSLGRQFLVTLTILSSACPEWWAVMVDWLSQRSDRLVGLVNL